MTETNFLIGRGELLTYPIKGPKRGGKKVEAYTLQQAQERLRPQLRRAARTLDELPKEACPEDYGVARLTLNPGYIARSYFPTALLRATGLQSVGSRTVRLKPERWTRKGAPEESSTTELFVAGKRESFRRLPEVLASSGAETPEALDFARIERFSALSPEERVRSYGSRRERFFEVGLHLLPDDESTFIREAFARFARRHEVKAHLALAFDARNLWFVPVEGPRSAVEALAQFTFVRIIRPMPRLRGLRPIPHGGSPLRCKLPEERPLSAEPRVAILDGGLPEQHAIAPWLRSYKLLDPAAADAEHGPEHGLGVTSAFLFGPIEPGGAARRPFAWVDHLRVFDDEASLEDPLELYRALGFVEQVLLSRQYEFLNLSLGPDLPVEDTDVHAWTSVIDDLLSDGDTFMTVAAGNNGELDRPSGNARVQVPSDCVNAVAVGATDGAGSRWRRATYSAFGPGRMPGVVKPDLMAFGGQDPNHFFHVLVPGRRPMLTGLHGTSFAAPYLLRSAVGIRAILGDELTPLAIKALLVHSAEAGFHDKLEVGWGKIPDDVLQVITCPTGVARVVYQGELKPGKYLRAPVPIPHDGLEGRVRLRATFCYASPVDPQDAACYTRAGLEIVFRPDESRIDEDRQNAATKGFFDMKKYATESERRSDTGKWETVLHGEKGLLGRSLNKPVFDIHYNARAAGGRAYNAEKIRYALVITVSAPRHPELYSEILRSYARILTPIEPHVPLPIRV